MLDLIKAMQDPEFTQGLAAMPQQIVDHLVSIEAKLDLLLQQNGITEKQQNSETVNLQISKDVFPVLDAAWNPDSGLSSVPPEDSK